MGNAGDVRYGDDNPDGPVGGVPPRGRNHKPFSAPKGMRRGLKYGRGGSAAHGLVGLATASTDRSCAPRSSRSCSARTNSTTCGAASE